LWVHIEEGCGHHKSIGGVVRMYVLYTLQIYLLRNI